MSFFFSWRQTSNCVWDGPRESANDKTCDTTILDGHSGYCQCADSTLRNKKSIFKKPSKVKSTLFGFISQRYSEDFFLIVYI